jgi:hypothetical protein
MGHKPRNANRFHAELTGVRGVMMHRDAASAFLSRKQAARRLPRFH